METSLATQSVNFADPFSDRRTSLIIREKICKDLSILQYDEFVYICRAKRLNPILKQIYPKVLDKGTNEERMVALVGIHGYRSIAKRTGTYLPGKEARVRRDLKLADRDAALSINPDGLISVTSYGKIFANGEWHEIVGSAKWKEFAPLWDVMMQSDRGMLPTGQKFLDKEGFWYIRPYHMLEKCADAVMLRKGWPDEYAGLWEEAEFAGYKTGGQTIDLSPSEAYEQGKTDRRLHALGGPKITVIWSPEADLDAIPVGQFADKVKQFIDLNRDDPATILAFRERNTHGLNELWAHNERASLELRGIFDEIYNKFHGRTSWKDRAVLRRPPSTQGTGRPQGAPAVPDNIWPPPNG